MLDVIGHAVAINVARHQDGAAKYILPVLSFYAWMQERGFRPMASGHHPGAVQPWLLTVPVHPVVPIHKVPPEVVDAFAGTFSSEKQARDHLATANALALQSNPERFEERQITLPIAEQPAFDVPRTFWSSVFSAFGARSRRSVAALLEARGAPNPQVQDDLTRRAFQSFKDYLSTAR